MLDPTGSPSDIVPNLFASKSITKTDAIELLKKMNDARIQLSSYGILISDEALQDLCTWPDILDEKQC